MAAAWAAWKKFGDKAEYVPVFYGTSLHDYLKTDYNNWANPYDGLNIDELYIVDFSFPRVQLEVVASLTKLVVLDHHKTAQKDLEGLDYCIFDMEKSGARLAWEYFHPRDGYGVDGQIVDTTSLEYNIPKLIQYIEDRDLWRFALPDSHFVNAYIQSFEMNMINYNGMAVEMENPRRFEEIIMQGKAIERYKNTMVEAQCKHVSIQDVGGYAVPVVNSTILFSEVGNKLAINYADRAPFAAYYTIRGDGKKQWGLRSIGNFDVSEVAKKLGGGGHRNAAGFIE